MSNLKPCKFCGKDPKLHSHMRDRELFPEEPILFYSCASSIDGHVIKSPVARPNGYGPEWDIESPQLKEKAIKLWNSINE